MKVGVAIYYPTDKPPPNLSNVLHDTMSGFLTYTVCEEVMHSDFTPFGAYWLNHIPLAVLLSTAAFTPLLGNTEGVKECEVLPWYVKSNIPILYGQKITQIYR